MKPIYLDHNATTPMDPEVIETVSETARLFWANPSSGHPMGMSAREEMEKRRRSIARFIGAESREIAFTSGGTEADNLAVMGAARANQHKGKHLLVSAVEHHAVLESCHLLRKEGFEITLLPVDKYGQVDPEDLRKEIRKQTILVSVMHSNNEVGTLEPIEEIGKITRQQGLLFHTDAAQSLGKVSVDVTTLNVDLLACSSHKIYGPKGMGFLYLRSGTRVSPLFAGGGQEGAMRCGTENLPGIAGLARALDIAGQRMPEEARRLKKLRDLLFEKLSHQLDGLHLNGHPDERLPGTLSVSMEGVRSVDLIEHLNRAGIMVSASAACTAGSVKPSHVLSAMHVSPEQAAGTLRLSLGRLNTEEEIPRIADTLVASVQQLRKENS